MFELASWKPWITTWSNVCWNVDPDPLSVTLAPPDDPPLLLLLHATSTTARATTTKKSMRERLRVVFKGFPPERGSRTQRRDRTNNTWIRVHLGMNER